MLKQCHLIFFLLVFVCVQVNAQSNFYEIQNIQKIEIFFSQIDWDYQLDTAKAGADDYILSDSVRINGTLLDSIGVKYKGNSSYNANSLKNPLHIELDRFKSHDYQGYKDIKLSNGYSDPSLIREVLSYKILNHYMHAPQSNFAQVYINGNYIGVYTNDENIGKSFCEDHFGTNNNCFIKCNPIITPGPTTKSNLKYISPGDSSNYFNFYEIKSDNGWNKLVALSDTVTNYQSSIGNNIDMDRVIWMLAFNNVLVNLDSYSGVFCQNYYLYEDQTKHFNPIIWDLNMAFGAFPFLGSGSSSFGTLSNLQMQQLPFNVHATDANWPLINAVFNNPTYKKMYVAHMKTICNEFFNNGQYIAEAQQLQAIIDTAVLSDANNFFSYNDFQNGLTTDVQGGTYTIPGISILMGARNTFLQSTTEFLFVEPMISNVQNMPSIPYLNTNVTINANVINASIVWLAYRFNPYLKFEKVLMYDDGLHNDGAANDMVYGAAIYMNDLNLQYYIYAENNDAAKFSPARAEHEFYSLSAVQALPNIGDVVINEFLAENTSGQQNELGAFEDWIELYNTSDTAINLYGLYLSDNSAQLNKFSFPVNTIIPAHGYQMIWADQEDLPTGIHANFKIASNGEELFLSDGANVIFDSIIFGSQFPNVSMARCPDGTGNFALALQVTYNASNCVDGLNSLKTNKSTCFPNPSNGKVSINFDNDGKHHNVKIYNVVGEELYSINTIESTETIDLSFLKNGIYFININQQQTIKVLLNK
jgi:hypothetical protein